MRFSKPLRILAGVMAALLSTIVVSNPLIVITSRLFVGHHDASFHFSGGPLVSTFFYAARVVATITPWSVAAITVVLLELR